jgi:hypothetical protein
MKCAASLEDNHIHDSGKFPADFPASREIPSRTGVEFIDENGGAACGFENWEKKSPINKPIRPGPRI